MTPHPQLLNEQQTRETLGGLGRTKLYELTATKAIRSVKIGRRRMWPVAAVEAFAKSLDQQDGAA